MKSRKNGMKRRMAALTALCLTGTLVLSGGWSQKAMASAVSETGADAQDSNASDSGTSSDAISGASDSDASVSDAASESGTPDAADSTENAPSEQPDGTDHSDGSQNVDEAGQTDASQPTDGETDAQTPEADEEQNPQTDEVTEDENAEQEEEEDPDLLKKDEEEEKPVARYEGITIDGDFSDWDAIAKVSVDEGKGWDTVDEVAMVWDGDYVYLYFMAAGNGDGTGNWNSVCGAGSHNNGQYAITTDLGRILPIQLMNDGTVGGIDGAQVAINNKEWFGAPHMWEVAIPSSALPNYQNTISFGLYQGQTFISDMANLQGNPDEDNKKFDGIVYDGLYGDWEYYPHVLIQYATAGTQEHVDDAEGAMYSADGIVYAHVVSTMPAHLQEAGGEFTSAVTIRLNKNKDFYPQFVAVAADGTIDYNAQLSGLAPGTYEFYMIDSQGWKTATNISQFEADGKEYVNEQTGRKYFNPYYNDVYGRMYVTIAPSEDNMEYEVYLDKLAAMFDISTDQIDVSGQWGRIGQEWVHTAGTPTGAGMGLFLCLSTTGIAYMAQRKRKKQV